MCNCFACDSLPRFDINETNLNPTFDPKYVTSDLVISTILRRKRNGAQAALFWKNRSNSCCSLTTICLRDFESPWWCTFLLGFRVSGRLRIGVDLERLINKEHSTVIRVDRSLVFYLLSSKV